MNLNSKELFINIKEKDIPYWNDLYPYDEQDDDVKQFWENEAIKLSEGITINGVFIHPWLYWHINFWHMMLDKGDRRVPGLSQLRDNEWFFSEVLQQAERENKGVFLFGTRRFGKALLNSEILYLEDREKQIGDILVGDYIYDDSGNLVEVDGVYPQGSVMTYKVVFEDGRNVICCGEHIWRVKIGHKWIDRNLKGIMMGDYTKMYIPISKPVNYPARKLPIQPSAFGTMLSSFLCGSISEIPFDKKLCKNFLRSSIDQKKIFIESFIRAYRNVVTGEEVINITNKDIEVIRFIQKMFWSYGWYANYEDGKLILSNNRKELRIKSISMYGKYPATCITVNNSNHLFLTTNYVVTHNSAIMSSFVARNATMTYNLTHNVIGSSKEDLMNIGEYMEYGLDNIHPFLKINRTGNDWFKEVILGTKNVRNERDVHARIRITNIDQGRPSAALKPAGGTPYTTIYDEVGKYPFLAPYEAGLPSHMQNGRIRGYIFAMGCCCAGTIVYKANGEPCKIEDLKQEDGILGYDFNKGKCVSQKIEWMKPPSIKHCYRIETYRGDSRHVLECSYDHPIRCSNANYRDYLYKEYVAASQLVEGDTIWVVQNNGYAYKEYVDSVVDIGEKMVYNLTASDTHTYLANDIITHNTGGNVEKSQDAQKVMNDPERYSFMVFDYDILNKKCIKPTWRISAKTACFAPGQMSHAFEKDKTTLDKYLNIEKAPGLKKIPISVTNFERSTESIDKKLESLAKGDKSSYVQYKMAYPKSVDDCFLNANVNRFPVEDALIHKSRLLEEGRPGKLVDIYQIENKKIGYRFSEKVLAPYPFQGGNIDAPVVIYEDPPEEGGLFDYTYTSGLDPYKQDKSGTSSLGALYILKRHVRINDPFAYKIVASVVSRPPKIDDFCRTCEILIEAYGAKCLMENADTMFQTYLSRRNKQFVLLEEGEAVANKLVNNKARQNNKLGLAPTVPNQRVLYNLVIQYCWEDITIGYDDDGNEIKQKGIYRIPDIELLDEIIAFGPGVNTDRIIAFAHALALAQYYDDMNYMPKSTTEKMNEEKREKIRRYQVRGFTTVRHNPFKIRGLK